MPAFASIQGAPFAVTTDDIEYARTDAGPLLARVYRPSDTCGARAALIDVHGGAWMYFDRTVDMYFNDALAACGMVVCALDFRQAPATRYPTAVADVVAGIRFVRAHAHALDIDADDIGLIGGSSGGHLLLLAALRPNAAEYATTTAIDAPAGHVSAAVRYALPLWPIADPLARYQYLLRWQREATEPPRDPFFQPERLIESHAAFFGDEATMARASVPRIIMSGEAEQLPPIWVAHPEWDENVTLAMSQTLVDTYRAAGGHAELEVFPSVGHSFANFPSAAADRCIAGMRAFIGRQLTTSV